MPWLGWLVAGLSPRRSSFKPGSVHVGFVADKVAVEEQSQHIDTNNTDGRYSKRDSESEISRMNDTVEGAVRLRMNVTVERAVSQYTKDERHSGRSSESVNQVYTSQ
jgi:hypothetical protein